METTASLTPDRNQTTEQSAPTELPGDMSTSTKLDKGMVDLLLESELFLFYLTPYLTWALPIGAQRNRWAACASRQSL